MFGVALVVWKKGTVEATVYLNRMPVISMLPRCWMLIRAAPLLLYCMSQTVAPDGVFHMPFQAAPWPMILIAVVDEGDTILISANAGPSQIAGELCNKNFFSTSWQNDQTPMAMGEYLNTKGVKSLYLVGPNYAAGKDMLSGVAATFKGKIAGEELTTWPSQLDFSAELAKAKAANPDAIFVFYPGRAGVQFLTGDSNATQTLPKAVVLCDSARAPGDLPEGLGNYECSVRITLFSNADDTTLAVHRDRCASIAGNMRDLNSIQAAFVAENGMTVVEYATPEETVAAVKNASPRLI